MTENKRRYLDNNLELINKLVNSGRKQGWFPVMKGKVFVMARCSNPTEVEGKKVCAGMTGITFFNNRGDRKVKCFRCFH